MTIPRTGWRWLLSGLAVIASGGCGDSTTEPTGAGPVTVSVSVLAVGLAQLSATPEGVALVTCLVDLKGAVRTHGAAAWGTAVFRFYPGSDLTQPVDSAVVPNTLVVQSWGRGGVSDLNPVFSSWQFTASVPFTVELEYHYQVGSDPVQTTDPVTAFCSPSVPANAAAVSITNVTTIPAGGSIQPGDTVSVTYTVAAPAGLWQTVVLLSGGCDTLHFEPEYLAQNPTRTVRVVVPAGCQLGAQLDVTVSVLDAALNSDSQSIPVPLTLVDLRPPVVVAQFPSRLGVFTGDTLSLSFTASDNNGLSAVIWELVPFGYRDSVLSSFPGLVYQVGIPILPGWTGPFELRVFARDGAGLESPVVTPPSGSLTSYPTVAGTVVSVFSNRAVGRLVFDLPRSVLYCLDADHPGVLVLSASTMQVVDSITLPGMGEDLDITPSGDSLIVTVPIRSAVGVIDLTQAVRQTITIPIPGLDSTQGHYPRLIRSLLGGRAMVSAQNGGSLIELDLTSGNEQAHPATALALERSPDFQVLVLRDLSGGMQRFDPGTGLGPQVPFLMPGEITLDNGGQLLGLSRGLFDPSFLKLLDVQTVRTLGLSPSVLSPDGQYIYYVDVFSGLVRARTSDGGIDHRVPLPQALRQSGWMGMSPDGARVALRAGNTIGVLDLP